MTTAGNRIAFAEAEPAEAPPLRGLNDRRQTRRDTYPVILRSMIRLIAARIIATPVSGGRS
jgi:hypothetical protein